MESLHDSRIAHRGHEPECARPGAQQGATSKRSRQVLKRLLVGSFLRPRTGALRPVHGKGEARELTQTTVGPTAARDQRLP